MSKQKVVTETKRSSSDEAFPLGVGSHELLADDFPPCQIELVKVRTVGALFFLKHYTFISHLYDLICVCCLLRSATFQTITTMISR